MTKQEENWELMTMLQIPWYEANKIDTREDRDFLLAKARQMREHISQQLKSQQSSSIVTPSFIKP